MNATRFRTPAVAALVAVVAAPVLAQTATITMSHDEPDGVIEPGETIRVKMRIAWSSPWMQLAGFAGQIRHDPTAGSGVGTVSNRSSPFWSSSGIINNGVVVGDDIVGIDVASVPGYFTPTVLPPWGSNTGFDAFTHDWTAPLSPGIYELRFVPTALRPHVFVYPSQQSPAFTQALTTYIPATITVTPAPAAGLFLASLAFPRRRRTR